MSDITNTLDDAAEEAIAEIKRLRSEVFVLRDEVERLRLTAEDVNTLERISMWLKHHGIVRDAASIAAIAKRQGGGE
jgi:hypothetical protein